MFVKLAVVACSLAFASAVYNGPLAGGQPASLYPAGVDPASCPNYPDCSNPAVAVNQVPQALTAGPQYPQFQPTPQYQPAAQYQPQYQPTSQYQPAPQYQPQQYSAPIPQSQQYAPSQPQYSPAIQSALDRGDYIGDGDYHGEGLAEALAPGYAGQGYSSPAYTTAQQYSAPAYNSAPAPAQYAGHAQPAQIPAGLNPQACPNYPFCH